MLHPSCFSQILLRSTKREHKASNCRIPHQLSANASAAACTALPGGNVQQAAQDTAAPHPPRDMAIFMLLE